MYTLLAATLVGLAAVFAIQRWFVALASLICDAILRIRYPIVHTVSNSPLPSLPFLFPNGQGNVEKFLNGRQNSLIWANKYGPIYRLWSGFSSEIVLTEPKHIETVFRDSHKHAKATANNSGYLMHQLLGDCVGLINGTRWKTLRSVTEPPFVRSATVNYMDFLQTRTRTYLSALSTNSDHPFSSQSLLDPIADLKFLPFLCVTELLYGKLDKGLEQRLLDMIELRESVFRTVIQGGITRFKLARLLPLQANRDLKKFKTLWAAFNDDAWALATKRATTGDSHGPPAPITAMYASIAAGQITREELLQTLDEMLFANLDVTMGGISWNIVFLAAHKSAQATLRREILDALGDTTTSQQGKTAFSNLLLHTSNYLTSCILESSRLRPLAAFSVPQSCPTERTLSGYSIPAGTNFVVDAYALNIRNPFWGKDPLTYRPERFLEREKGNVDMRYNYWRFGFGPRQCLGRYVADVIIKCLLIELVLGYDLDLVYDGPGSGPENKFGAGKKENKDQEEWEFDKQTWIHHPQMRIKCTQRQ